MTAADLAEAEARAGAPPARTEAERQRLATRTVGTLVAGVAMGSTGHIAATTIAVIAAGELAGGAALAGAAGSALVAGAAAGAALLSQLMVRYGRRIGLSTGYGLGVVGALVGAAAILLTSLPVLIAGMVLIGFGNASNQLSRYTAADLFPHERRASAIGLVVWAATAGAVIGPNLVGPSGTLAVTVGLPELVGPFLVPMVFVGVAAVLSFVRLRPDPYHLAWRAPGAEPLGVDVPLRTLLGRPTVVAAIAALVVGQAVMVLIMTMTPFHMREQGHDLAAVGLVISAHTFGMFALSPISGRLSDRLGAVPVVLAGSAMLAAAAGLAALAPTDGGLVLTIALFLLGWGWNLGFVAGSALLTSGLELAERTRIQGLADAVIWSSSAAASLSSGVIVSAAGYTTLGILGAAAVVVPVWVVLSRRRAVAAG